MRRHMLALTATTAAVCAGCGSSTSPSTNGGAALSVPTGPAQMTRSKCLSEVGPFLDSMQQIDSRLNVGMTESEFVARTGTAEVKHDQLDPHAISGACLTAGADLETALNRYAKAANKWRNCIASFSCTFHKINRYMQAQWAAASVKITRAKTQLDSLH
jgi:hypothetical protein